MQPPPPQHQQQTMVTNAGVMQPPSYIAEPYFTAAPRTVESYRHRQSTVIGVLLVIIGCMSIIFNIVDLAVGNSDHWTHYRYDNRVYPYWYRTLSDESNGVSGHGFWCGAMVIIAGGFGIAAGRHKTRAMIISFMVFAIIGTVLAAIQVIIAGTGAGNLHDRHGAAIDVKTDCYYCSEAKTVFAMAVLLAVCGAFAFALCLWGSVLGCMSGDCCAPPQPTVFTMMPVGQPQVTVLTQQQPMQPIAMAQLPPPYAQTVAYASEPQDAGYQTK